MYQNGLTHEVVESIWRIIPAVVEELWFLATHHRRHYEGYIWSLKDMTKYTFEWRKIS